jgi:hypothetical protein
MSTFRGCALLVALVSIYAVQVYGFDECENFNNTFCDCDQQSLDVYCDYFPDSCPSDFCDKVNDACDSIQCQMYGCWVDTWTCEGWCIACPA